MRFIFEESGRTGCKSMEALADFMDSWVTFTKATSLIEPNQISLENRGNMMVDFSPTQSAPGEFFKDYKTIYMQWIRAGASVEAMRNVAKQYWAEGEAIELSRATAAVEAKPSEQGTQRL